jgi:cysteine-S-conjugate beta-lyase
MMPAANLRRSFMTDKTRKIDTILTHAGSDPAANFGVINPPVYRASTVIHPTMQSLEDRQKDRFARGNISYGRHGTPTTFAFEDAVAEAEGGARAVALPSGCAAVNAAILAFVRSGDHVLIADPV